MATETALVPDFTYISTFARCGRRGELKYEKGLRLPEVSVPAHAGTAMHAALNVLYTQEWSEAKALEALRAAWAGLRPTGRYDWLTLGHLEICLRNYMEDREQHPTELERADPPDAGFSALAEKPVVFDWISPEGEILTLGGKLDDHREIGGSRMVVDHKCTTSWLNEWWRTERHPLMHQLRVYQAALQTLTGVTYDGGYLNGVYIGKAAADPPEAWRKRKSVQNKLFGPFHFSAAQLAETRQWAEGWLETVEFWRERGHFPQNEGACHDYGGCEFLSICRAHPVVRPSIIGRDFERWEPKGTLASGADDD